MNFNNTIQLYLKVIRKDIAFLDSVFESFEGYGVVRTLNAGKGDVLIMVPPHFKNEVVEILENLKKEIHWEYMPYCEV